MARLILRIAALVFLIVCVIVAADWIVWRIQMARGNGTADVTVTQVSAAELKRNKEEYYFDGSITITCARSLFPPLTSNGWLPPCWYLRRHTTVVTHI
ncbi:hypothetical protein [Terriglobus sp. RCC_193]|uniref:hypothetical protein n=1 Tax=Terriglobus sp. RCC_193 TaxID=3239218 RepID=UPI0035265FED